ncbi:dihydroxyacetone kinase subunit DhaK [Staphylococcus argensis]|uniref:Dihydroxyacetone kinase subunit DhaK n=1 Tax=Staphylococcus argensis TaxID=1607738 RepID=A0A2K4FD94_9STAP|nr:dihydroxyacetone kinase subunit DhaK [Staphylococcus argensis]MCY6990813.1 dihydroxyacetone kinase subunit DhaK [Staphylococcus argensis]POA09330.1 dihydroxyacetone kinase subunit DhaK [Staphylococcus argensis]
MKKLIKSKTDYVQDMLAGLNVSQSDIEIIEDTVVVRKHKKSSGVALVSGGGSGHEPAHAGYVAEGMLDAAVCGEIFTSPTPDKILSAIKAVATDAGVLLIVKNYAGDVMNFEMAQEMAEMEGISVKMVIVKDDIAVDNEEQRRGVAGTVFVHKYAGYLADQGVSLEDIVAQVEHLLTQMKSIGMALQPPYVPTTEQFGFDLHDDQMEIGIGIHGERGIKRTEAKPIDEIVKQLVERLREEVTVTEWIVMVNGMGGTPLSELHIVAKYLNAYLDEQSIAVKNCYVGDYMTSLNMEGFSLTVIPYDAKVDEALKAPTMSAYFN